MAFAAGNRVGAYEITASLGAGGMGEVYRARDKKLGRDVALKVLPEAMASSPEALSRFAREARAVAALSHPHIVTIYSTEEAAGVHFITMEFVEGRTLDRLIPRDGIPWSRFFDIAAALADALSAAHQKQITHRDLKPANVMVSDDGRVKVLDFGLARAPEPEPGFSSESTQFALTQAGVVVGTMPYMSPEQIEGKPVDHRSDLFSLGIVLYEMATGARPFSGDSSPALMSSILKDQPRPIAKLRSDIPAGLADLIDRCLRKPVQERVQSAREILIELRDLRRTWESGSSTAPLSAAPGAGFPAGRAADLRVAVLPFVARGMGDVEALADGLTDDITAGLSRFQHLRVVSRNETEKFKGQSADARMAESVGARYLLDGTVRAAGSAVRLSVRLVDASTGAHLWAETYERDLGRAHLFAVQDDITAHVVAAVADKSGVLVRSMGTLLRSRPCEALSVTDLVLRYYAYEAQYKADEHVLLRSALERALERDPFQANGWACLAALYHQEHGAYLNPLPGTAERQRRAAERATELDPTCQDGWVEVAAYHFFFDRDQISLRVAAERVVALNPLDTQAVASAGAYLAHSGDWDRGIELCRQAIEHNPCHPGWYHFPSVTYHYVRHEYEESLAAVKRVNMPGFHPVYMLLAAIAGQMGRPDDAQAALQNVERVNSAFLEPAKAREWWSRWHRDAEIVEHLMEGFLKARTLVADGAKETKRVDAQPQVSSDAKKLTTGPSSAAGAALARAASIAVLPFADMSAARDQDWFCDGIAEEILNALTQLKGLTVAARTSAFSFKGKSDDLRTIGERLNVATVLEGSVRRAGDRVRITAQLSDVQNGYQLWSERYDRELKDIFDVQDQIARAIAARLKATLAGGAGTRLVARATENLEAYQTYLKGRALLYRRGPSIPLALQQFQKAVDLDPDYAQAWAGIADVYTVLGYYGTTKPEGGRLRALEAANRAIVLDPDSAEAHTALAGALLFYKGDPEGAEREFLKALELNPNYIQGRCWYAVFYLLWTRGLFDESVAQARRALESDPLSSYVMTILALCLGAAGQADEAIATARRSRDADPESFIAVWAHGQCLSWAGRYDESVAVHRESSRISSQSSFAVMALATATAQSSHPDGAVCLLDALRRQADSSYVSSCHLAITAAAAGAQQEAQVLLERGWNEHDPFIYLARHYQDFQWFRGQQEFVEILRLLDQPVSDPHRELPNGDLR